MAGIRILIVDDEPQIRNFLSATFEHAGYAVTTAGSGPDAIARFTEEPFDVVLSDVMMPEMDGHQLAQWIAAHRPGTRTALMSGFDGTCQERAYSPRCQLISKPFLPSQIVTFVEQVLTA